MTAFDVLLHGGTVIDGSGRAGRARRCRHPRRPDPRRRRSVAGRSGRRRARPGPGRAGRDARLHRPARPLGRIAVPRRRPGQPPPPGLHDPAVGQLRRHASRRSPTPGATSSTCRSGRTSSRRAGRPSGSTSIGSPSSRSVRTSRSSSATARSAGPSSVPTPGRRPPTSWRRWSARSTARWTRVRWVSRPGLIYAPGMHAPADEVEALVAATTRRGGMYATHMRNECDGLFESLDESIAAIRAAGPGGRLQVSHLKCGSRSVWGRADDAVARLERARAEGLDVGADQYPYTAAATTLATILPPALQALGVDDCVVRAGRSRTSAISSGPRSIAGSPAGRTWPRILAGAACASRSRQAAPSGPAGR